RRSGVGEAGATARAARGRHPRPAADDVLVAVVSRREPEGGRAAGGARPADAEEGQAGGVRPEPGDGTGADPQPGGCGLGDGRGHRTGPDDGAHELAGSAWQRCAAVSAGAEGAAEAPRPRADDAARSAVLLVSGREEQPRPAGGVPRVELAVRTPGGGGAGG